jgi:hypothetical protein
MGPIRVPDVPFRNTTESEFSELFDAQGEGGCLSA